MISQEYKDTIVAMHQKENWGSSGKSWVDTLEPILKKFEPKTILDFGCGQGTLKQELIRRNKWKGFVTEYDPGIPGKDKVPTGTYDMVVCTDVMEHIEPAYVQSVLQQIISYKPETVFFVIATRPAKAVLPDGRNAHLIIEKPKWWCDELDDYFTSYEVDYIEGDIWPPVDHAKRMVVCFHKKRQS